MEKLRDNPKIYTSWRWVGIDIKERARGLGKQPTKGKQNTPSTTVYMLAERGYNISGC